MLKPHLSLGETDIHTQTAATQGPSPQLQPQGQLVVLLFPDPCFVQGKTHLPAPIDYL